jgi:hypothetical protein
MNKIDYLKIIIHIIKMNENNAEEYLKTLNEKEKKAIDIARDCLNSSFNLYKSLGFLKWLEEKNINVK